MRSAGGLWCWWGLCSGELASPSPRQELPFPFLFQLTSAPPAGRAGSSESWRRGQGRRAGPQSPCADGPRESGCEADWEEPHWQEGTWISEPCLLPAFSKHTSSCPSSGVASLPPRSGYPCPAGLVTSRGLSSSRCPGACPSARPEQQQQQKAGGPGGAEKPVPSELPPSGVAAPEEAPSAHSRSGRRKG